MSKRKRCMVCGKLFHSPSGLAKHTRACVARRQSTIEEMQETADSYRPGPAVTARAEEHIPIWKVEIDKEGKLTMFRGVS